MKLLINHLKFNKKDVNTYLILVSAPVLLTVYSIYGNAKNICYYFTKLGELPLDNFYCTIIQFFFFFVLTFIVPLIFIKFRLKQPLVNFGCGLGDKKFGVKLLLISIPLLVAPLIFLASKMPAIRLEYPLCKLLFTHRQLIIWYELAYVIFYYIAWEFYFRGFLLFGLKDRFGNMSAILIQTIPSCLLHIGKPGGEFIGSIFVGILFGAIALRTRSIWYVFVLHACIGVFTDIFILAF